MSLVLVVSGGLWLIVIRSSCDGGGSVLWEDMRRSRLKDLRKRANGVGMSGSGS